MDWFVVLIVVCIIGLLSTVYYLHYYEKKSTDHDKDIKEIAAAAAYNEELFSTHFKEKDAYEEQKSQTESSALVNNKQLIGLLLKRGVAIVERAHALNKELSVVRSLHSSGLLSPSVLQSVQDGIKAVEQEQVDVKSESDLLRPGWSNTILSSCVNLSSIGVAYRRDARLSHEKAEKQRQKEEQQKEMIRQREQEQQTKKAAKAADAAYHKLLQEEERKKGNTQTSSPQHQSGSHKGSKKKQG